VLEYLFDDLVILDKGDDPHPAQALVIPSTEGLYVCSGSLMDFRPPKGTDMPTPVPGL